jgi:hypothetical protein
VERTFKEVLYRFLEEVHCTKAALYLAVPERGFALAARYGFGRGDAPPERLPPDEGLVVAAAGRDGAPLVVNSVRDAPALERRLLAAGARRLLLIPLMDDTRMIGLVDARDKGGQQAFTQADARTAAAIGARLVDVARGLRLVPAPPTVDGADEVEELVESLPPAPTTQVPPLLDLPAVTDLTEAAARAVAGSGMWAVAVTVIEDEKASTLVISRNELEPSEDSAIRTHQIEALLRVGGALPRSSDWRLEARRLPGGDSGRRPALVTSAVPLTAGTWSLVLSVIAAEGGGSPAPVLDRLRAELGGLHEMSTLRFARRSLARRLLEPGESRYPELVAHSVSVSRLCAGMAGAEGLDDRGVEQAAMAGLLHDVGMRELDYGRLYRLADPRPEHHRVYRRHVLVGERILRGVGLEEVAAAVRHHHERWDGTGYPDRLGGDEIPWLARMVHAAEVFDVLTSESSYRSPVPAERALATISAAAGGQFDPAMVKALHKVV